MPGELLIGKPDSQPGKKGGSSAVMPWTWQAVARAGGWIGLTLLLAALIDSGLALVPMAFGNAEWETGTISSLMAGLPLVTIGLGGMWVSAACLTRRWLLATMGFVLLGAAASVLVLLLLFTLNVPTALHATQNEAHLVIQKLVLKTLVLGLTFSIAYIVMGVLSFRQARGVPSTETAP